VHCTNGHSIFGRFFLGADSLPDVDASMDVDSEETFGRVSPFFRFHGEAEVMEAPMPAFWSGRPQSG
jgi:hypothetical protein